MVGVNDESQINNGMLREDPLFKDVFIKRRINSQMGQGRTERAEEIINHSKILCIFGMSLGDTDKQWWEYIIQWMLSDKNRKLIIYLRKNPKLFKRHIPTSVIRERDKVKREFWKKGKGNHDQSLYESVSSRIFVIFNSNIFDFPRMEQMQPVLSAVEKAVLSGDYSNLLAKPTTRDKA